MTFHAYVPAVAHPVDEHVAHSVDEHFCSEHKTWSPNIWFKHKANRTLFKFKFDKIRSAGVHQRNSVLTPTRKKPQADTCHLFLSSCDRHVIQSSKRNKFTVLRRCARCLHNYRKAHINQVCGKVQ
jgi:hypothetical protein